jgi:hypothetical protein
MIRILSNLSVGAKLTLGFAASLLLMAGSGLLSLKDMATLNVSLHRLARSDLPAVANAAMLAQSITNYRLAEHRLLSSPASARDDIEQSLRDHRLDVERRVALARNIATSPQEGELVTRAERE